MRPPMDLSPILNPLNDAQRAAVTAPLGPVLVLAGAGSGKTRVLTHRIIWVIQAENASPHSILAVTFTNKAAAEMKERVQQLVRATLAQAWISTFHSFCARLIRRESQHLGLPRDFAIYDDDDQTAAVKRALAQRDIVHF